jgi:Tol biopolymer transport system component
MPDTVNPYIPGQPVDNPDLFFDRRDVLVSIREHLLKGRRVFVVSSAPRMGKSSLLRQLPYHLTEEFVPVRVDLLDEDAQDLDQLLWRLAEIIDHQVSQQLGMARLNPGLADFEGNTNYLWEQFWPQIRASLGNRCLLLMVDDVDTLDVAEDDLLGQLITVLETGREQDDGLAIVLTMSVGVQERLMRSHARLFGGALTYTLGPLASAEASRLITWPVDGVLAYDYGVARRIIEITSGQPYYLQLLCFEVFNRCAVAGWVNQRDVDLVVEDLVGREIADFRQVWDESSPQEQAVLATLVSQRGARGVATVQEVCTILEKAGARAEREQVSGALESLAERGILERLGALSYRFRVALLRDWLCERLDLHEIVRSTRWDAAESSKGVGRERIVKLSVRKQRWRKPRAEPRQAALEPGEREREEPGTTRRWWPWVVALILIGVVVLAVFGPRLLRSSPEQPIAVAEPSPTSAVGLATVTLTIVPVASVRPTIVASATDTPTPKPTETPSPTPPVVVARSMPSIAYQSREPGEKAWYVHVMDSDGSNRVRLVEGQAGFLAAPSWSPDGSQIAFVSDVDGETDIWVMSSDGSSLVNLTEHEAKDHSPAWSPDGEWIAFASVRDSLYWELYRMRPDGSDVERLTWWEDASDLSPTWSPDGTRLAFASKRDGNWEIYTMDRDGGNLARLTEHPADDTNPAWSPDSSRIAFVSTRDGYAEIYLIPIVGGEAVNISNAPFSSEHGPTWSPDGGRIAFYSDRDGDWDIYVMASDGSDVVKLTGDNSDDQVPAWRP